MELHKPPKTTKRVRVAKTLSKLFLSPDCSCGKSEWFVRAVSFLFLVRTAYCYGGDVRVAVQCKGKDMGMSQRGGKGPCSDTPRFQPLGGLRSRLLPFLPLDLQLGGWLALFLLLFQHYDSYKAVGHVSFSGTSTCICCYVNVNGEDNPKANDVPYYCFPQNVLLDGWTVIWGDFCGLSPVEIRALPHRQPPVDPIGRPLPVAYRFAHHRW